MKRKEFTERYLNSARDSIINIFGIMKGITLGALGLAGLSNLLLYQEGQIENPSTIFIILVTNIFAILLTYDGANLGALFTTKSNWWTSISWVILTLFEFSLMTIMIPLKDLPISEIRITYWFLFLGIFSLASCSVIVNETQVLLSKSDFEDLKLWEITKSYKKSQLFPIILSFLSSVFFIVVYIFQINDCGILQNQLHLVIIGLSILVFAFFGNHITRFVIGKKIRGYLMN